MPNYYGNSNNIKKIVIATNFMLSHIILVNCIVLLNFAGTTDYLKSVDPNMVWYGACSHLCDESPPWYSPNFNLECADSIQDECGIDLNRDSDISNCLNVYNCTGTENLALGVSAN